MKAQKARVALLRTIKQIEELSKDVDEVVLKHLYSLYWDWSYQESEERQACNCSCKSRTQ